MGDHLAEAEIHLAAVRMAERRAIPFDLQVQVHAAVALRGPQLVRRDGDGRVQRHVEAYGGLRLRRRGAHRYLVDDDANSPLKSMPSVSMR